ncbi:MAG: hypothetical protein NC236_01520 [Mycoplasma sp.]|nr:hypothetical protein [Mycoplasma sp.]
MKKYILQTATLFIGGMAIVFGFVSLFHKWNDPMAVAQFLFKSGQLEKTKETYDAIFVSLLYTSFIFTLLTIIFSIGSIAYALITLFFEYKTNRLIVSILTTICIIFSFVTLFLTISVISEKNILDHVITTSKIL